MNEFFINNGELFICHLNNTDNGIFCVSHKTHELYYFSNDFAQNKVYDILNTEITSVLQYLIMTYNYDFYNIFKTDLFKIEKLYIKNTYNMYPYKFFYKNLITEDQRLLRRCLDTIFIDIKLMFTNNNISANTLYIYPTLIIKQVIDGYMYYFYIDIK